MNIDDDVKRLVEKVEAGTMKGHLDSLEGSDFGIYLPVYEDQGTIKLMMEGYSQTEKNLVVSVSKEGNDSLVALKPVAWMGGKGGADRSCKHGGTTSCGHCGDHSGGCQHCSSHADRGSRGDLDAPRLDYDRVMDRLINRRELVESLAKEEFGLALLHGHSEKHMFTKLPEGYVSVISNGVTSFRTEQEIQQDATFVPNMWRSINGELRVAGGFSLTKTED